MYQRDYLLRMIEDFFRFLSIAIKLKGNKQYNKALDMLDETAQKLLNVHLNELMEDEENLESILTSETRSPEQIEMLAELLKVKAEIHLETNQVFSAIAAFEKSQHLYTHCQSVSKTYSMERMKKMEEISFALKNLRETDESLML